jgi:hypothetical protein
MPILPLDHPDPFAATLGVMLYPGADDDPPRFVPGLLHVGAWLCGLT